MNNYVSFNAKYYKNSNAEGEIGHVQRAFAENKNSIKELQKNNFDCGYSIIDRYKEIFSQAESHKKKKIQKDANTFIDGVLSFSRDQFEELMQDSDYKEKFSLYINEFMEKVKEATGLEPVGWAFHADEGHKDEETGKWNMNYHAQLIFFNYDFKTGKAPLRDMMKRGSQSPWSKLQNLAGEVFQPLGFQRGISKDMTKAKHLEKDKFIAEKHKKLLEEQKKLMKIVSEQEKMLRDNDIFVERAARYVDYLEKEQKRLVNLLDDVKEDIELRNHIKNSINETFDIFSKKLKENKGLRAVVNFLKEKLPSFYSKLSNLSENLASYFNRDPIDFGKVTLEIEDLKETTEQAEETFEEVKTRLRKIKI